MARQFGVTTGKTGLTGVVLNTCNKKTSMEWSEPRDEDGRVTDRKGISLTESLSFAGVLDAAEFSYKAGQKLTVGEKDYGIDSTDVGESKDATSFSMEVSNKDGAEITPYVAPSGT